MSLRDIIQETDARRRLDAKRYEELDEDVCQVCGTKGGDRRSLYISCLYDLHEASPKFIELWHCGVAEPLKGFFYLRICKGCRAALLELLHRWMEDGGRLAHGNLDDDGIYSYTPDEWERTQPRRGR